ncbi:Hsp20/alpha crystallin family protein [Candidatus Woesearchaeota archaeon]|nr:Hsp20/alpha crystallin family protein [Candidatus Woesearchaeota archaeon]
MTKDLIAQNIRHLERMLDRMEGDLNSDLDLFSTLFPDSGGYRLPRVYWETTKENYTGRLEMPGAKKEDITVHLDDNVLHIDAKSTRKEDKQQWQSSYSRSMTLPRDIDKDKIEATYENGILNIILPRMASAEPEKKTIVIK